jgi:hypothetical protein
LPAIRSGGGGGAGGGGAKPRPLTGIGGAGGGGGGGVGWTVAPSRFSVDETFKEREVGLAAFGLIVKNDGGGGGGGGAGGGGADEAEFALESCFLSLLAFEIRILKSFFIALNIFVKKINKYFL